MHVFELMWTFRIGSGFIFFFVFLQSHSLVAQRQVAGIRVDRKPKDIFFQEFHGNFIFSCQYDSSNFKKRRVWKMEPSGEVSVIPYPLELDRRQLAGVTQHADKLYYYLLEIKPKAVFVTALSSDRSLKTLVTDISNILTHFVKDDTLNLLSWNKEEERLQLTLLAGDKVSVKSFPIEKKFRYFFEDPSRIKFLDDDHASNNLFQGLAENKIYKTKGHLLALTDNIYNGTHLLDFHLSSGKVEVKKFPVIDGEAGGLTSVDFYNDKVYRATLGERKITLAVMPLSASSPSAVLDYPIDPNKGVDMFIRNSQDGLLRGINTKSKFKFRPETQRLALVTLPGIDSSLSLMIGLQYINPQNASMPYMYGVSGALMGMALEPASDLKWFYLSVGGNGLGVPLRPISALHAIDQYELLTRQSTPVRFRYRVISSIGSDIYMLYWDRQSDEFRLLRFNLW